MTIIAVTLNYIAAAMLFFSGMAAKDKNAPAHTAIALFVMWFVLNLISMVML